MLCVDGQALELRIFMFAALYCSAITDQILVKGYLLEND